MQSQNSSRTIIRAFCLTGGCETTALSLWIKIALSPSGKKDIKVENAIHFEKEFCVHMPETAVLSVN